MSGLESLLPLYEVLDGATDYLEYWRNYKGERITIREGFIRHDNENYGTYRQETVVIEGTVEKVLSVPPGFMLSDVEEYLVKSDVSLRFNPNSTEPRAVTEGHKAKQVLRTVDEKFVSFSNISQLERASVAKAAEEPFRSKKE